MSLTSQIITAEFPDLDKVEALNREAFPEEERVPISEFLRYTNDERSHFFAFYNEEEFVGFAFAVYNVQPKKLLDEFGTLETTGWGMFVGGVLVTPFTKVWSIPGHWDIMTVAMTIGVVFLGTIVAFSCYLHGISMLGPVQGSMLGCVEPLVATILSATVLGQAFGMIDVVGILCIVGAVTALTVVDA